LIPVRWRLTIWFGALLGITMLASVLLSYVVVTHRLTGEMDARLQQLGNQVHRDLNIPQQEELDLHSIVPSKLVSSTDYSNPGVLVQVVDESGAVVATTPNLRGGQMPTSPEPVSKGLQGEPTVVTLQTTAWGDIRMATTPMIHGESVIGLIQVGESLHDLNQELSQLALLMGVGVLTAWLLAVTIGWLLAGRALEPVSALTEMAASIAATGGFGDRVSYSGPQDEIGRLAGTFNRMIDRLEATFQSQRKFIADSSHELGTPIAVIRGNADLLSRPLPTDEAREAIRAIQSESGRVKRIVSDLLDMAELDLATDNVSQSVRLDQLAQEVLTHTRAFAAGKRLHMLRADQVSVAGNPDRLLEMLLNLVDNAIKYTPDGGTITLSVRKVGRWAEAAVADTGIGIPREEQDKIFDRFYRVDKARSRARGGTGLGLAIAKAIVEGHGGEISVRSLPGHGSTFIVLLPAIT
jgi:two-component system, OmpR family, sensor kinase